MSIEIRGLNFSYSNGGEPVLRDLALSLGAGECAAVLGRNGAGKSTLASVLCGLAPDFTGGELSGVAELGTGGKAVCVLQNVDAQVLNDSVREELAFFLKYSESPRFSSPEDALRGTGVEGLLERKTYQLSSGEKQNFVLAASLACVCGAVVVLDEPSAFLDAESVALLSARLLKLKREGASIIIFGHQLGALAPVVDKWFLLEGGVLHNTAAPAEDYYRPVPAPDKPDGEVIFSGRGLGCVRGERTVFSDFSFELHSGSVLGIGGRNGSGKTTLARMLSGLDGDWSGELFLRDVPAVLTDLRREVRLVLNNPYHSLLYRTVLENIRACVKPELLAGAQDALAPLGLEDGEIARLSCGQAQKVQFLCALFSGAKILVLDECFSAVDSDSVACCSGFLSKHCAGGGAVVFISHNEELVASLCPHSLRIGGGSFDAH